MGAHPEYSRSNGLTYPEYSRANGLTPSTVDLTAQPRSELPRENMAKSKGISVT